MRIYIRPQLPDPPDIDDLIFEDKIRSREKGSKKPRLGVVATPAGHFYKWAAVYFSL